MKPAQQNSRTRTAKATAQKEYNEPHREVKKSIRTDKKGHIDNLAKQAEETAA